MDPEPCPKNLNNSLIESKKVKPYISYEENNGIKTFKTVSMIDDSESIVFSIAYFDNDYNFLKGQINAISCRTDEYMAIKKYINNGDIVLPDLVNYPFGNIEISKLTTTKKTQKFEISINGQMKEIPYMSIDAIVLDDMRAISKIDKMNNYLMNHNKNKSLNTNVFKQIEKEYTRFTVIKNTGYQKAKSA